MSDEEKKYFDGEGNEIEGVLTAEEAEAQKDAALKEYQERNPNDETLKTSLEEKETLLKEKGEELEKERKKEKNFAELRKKAAEKGIKLEEKDEEFGKFQQDTKSEIDALRNEISSGKRTEAINKLSDDEEVKKKIKFHLDRFSKFDDDQEAFEGNLKDAYFLATKQEAPTGNYISSAGAGNATDKKEGLSENAKALAEQLGANFIKDKK